ncbi:GIY-YIG nuclease family protein [Pectobacterium aquaticum]|uniref:GIY-YIG nuclease family protein n=1 Tax=Pectobacterium aquaticum TaxID=2204145 RepID=UPI000E25C5CD|nr:GIY-YIG nuclease family protein [Pectobacterium aquaticum]RRN96456.1 GIY-YIG nuclease family protein [Pectobacterium aquaticum]
MNRLIEIGFIKVGYWKILDGTLKYFPDERYADVINNLYAFVCDGEVMYVGKTTGRLKDRMYQYIRPNSSQSTNIKNNKNIYDILKKDIAVDIFVLPDSGLIHYGQFHLNLAAGLEDSIINIINPEWNGGKKASVISESDSKSTQTPDETLITSKLEHKFDRKEFTFNMAETYWKRGFFNVPAFGKDEFGSDGDEIKIIFHDGATSVIGIINRTANRTKSPRIMGGVDLKKYFQETYNIGDVVSLEVITPHAIKLNSFSE